MNWLRDPKTLTALLLAWALLTVAAFWHMEGQYLRPVSRPKGAVDPQAGAISPLAMVWTDRGMVPLARTNSIVLLNFWNPVCPCSRFMEGHVRDLGERYKKMGVRLVTVVECGKSLSEQEDALAAWRGRNLPDFAAVADPNGRIARIYGVWAAPAAVIINAKGRIVYVGAYNVARYCDATQTAFAAMALAAVVEGKKPPRSKTAFYGCQVTPMSG
ncbi:MAG TPA: TlpA disulfide reductase family protein [Capsulimonadaceae bacterium]|nr:TlpA disulfide reductase family protein [Capsulimonadaceae bacterium]